MNLQIKEVSKNKFLELVYDYHYSIVMPRHTKHYLGAFLNDRLVGGLSLGWGTQPLQTIKKLFPTLETKDYYEIGKMVMLDEMPRNSESQMLAEIVKWIKHNLPIQYLYTWADGIVGKPGYVYQAANFYYGGFIWTDIYISAEGEKIHPRSAKQLLKDNADFEGKEKLFWLTPAYCQAMGIKRYRGKQFRYIYPMSGKARKELEYSTVKWSNREFPKDKDLVWKVQVGKGEYVTTDEKPEFHKLSINVNRGNYDANFGQPSRRRTPHAPDGGDRSAQQALFSPEVLSALSADSSPVPPLVM